MKYTVDECPCSARNCDLLGRISSEALREGSVGINELAVPPSARRVWHEGRIV
jgi:hypothetical protein